MKEEIICYDVDGEPGCFHRPDECCDCDHDVMNGGDIQEDVSIIHLERQQTAYEFDPINNEPPYSWNGVSR